MQTRDMLRPRFMLAPDDGAGTGDNDTKPDPDKGTGGDDDGGTDTDPKADADKWKALACKHEKQAKENAAAAKRLAEIEDGNKSEIERATTKAAEAEQRAAAAEATALKLEVALDKAPEGMSLSQVRKLAKRLHGDSREDLEADAEDLFEDYAPADSGKGDDDGGDKSDRQRRPKERLRPGAGPDKDPDPDPNKLADEILSNGF